MNLEEKKKKIEEARSKMKKEFGEDVVMALSDSAQMDIEVISTGSMYLNLALGVGGFARGRVIEIYGPESSGKTTIAIHTIAEAHKDPESMCAIIDAEHAFDRDYAQNLGVDLDRLYIAQPDNGEQGLEIADRLINTGVYDVVVIDSVAALVPRAELEGEMGENKMGLHARLMSQALRKMTGAIKKTNTVCIFINQLREKIGVMFGSPEVTTGGNALKFYASQRLDVRRSTTEKNSITEGDVKMGNLTKVTVIKNKVAPPFRKCEFNILFGKGIDKLGEVIEMGKQLDILGKRNNNKLGYAEITYRGQKYPEHDFAGMLEDDDFYNEIYADIKKKINGESSEEEPARIEESMESFTPEPDQPVESKTSLFE